MIMKTFSVLLAAGMLASTTGIVYAKDAGLTVLDLGVYEYRCDNGSMLRATYYTLSDKSLNFTKLELRGHVSTLPQLLSADGGRYSDDRQQWWING